MERVIKSLRAELKATVKLKNVELEQLKISLQARDLEIQKLKKELEAEKLRQTADILKSEIHRIQQVTLTKSCADTNFCRISQTDSEYEIKMAPKYLTSRMFCSFTFNRPAPVRQKKKNDCHLKHLEQKKLKRLKSYPYEYYEALLMFQDRASSPKVDSVESRDKPKVIL